MPFVLKIDSYAPVLKTLGQREEVEIGTVVWIVVILLALPLLLFLGNYLRIRIQRNRNLDRGYDHLEKLSTEKGLDYLEETTAERMAKAAKLQNPALLLTSVAVFDRAVAIWMAKAQQMPWLEMEKQVEHLTSIREKVGFRYLPPGRPPTTTRELAPDQKLYLLAAGRKGYRLLSATLIDLDDLAIRTGPFKDRTQRPVRLRKQQEVWAFFWTEEGGEYRFKTHVLKEVDRPAPYLMLRHGDELISSEKRKFISCDLDLEGVAEWLPASRFGRSTPSLTLFDKVEEIETLPVRLRELSGSGFTVETNEEIEVGDLVRLKGGSATPELLEEVVGRAVKVTRSGARFKFFKLSAEDRNAILHHIVPRMSPDALHKSTNGKSQVPT